MGWASSRDDCHHSATRAMASGAALALSAPPLVCLVRVRTSADHARKELAIKVAADMPPDCLNRQMHHDVVPPA